MKAVYVYIISSRKYRIKGGFCPPIGGILGDLETDNTSPKIKINISAITFMVYNN